MGVETFVDWRGRPCMSNKYGGMRAALFVLGIQACEIMAIAAVGNNLITYVFNEMHFPLPRSANIVTNFIGTIFLLSLLGGFLADSYLGSFSAMLLFGFMELSGLILLSIQAHLPDLRPPKCNMISKGGECMEARGSKEAIFFISLCLVALGSGCLKPNMISHGADQFAADDPGQPKKLSTYFNLAYFSFCVGELVALTLMVWVQMHSGMDVGFGLSVIAMVAGILFLVGGMATYRNRTPQGSIFAPIARVILAACSKREQICLSSFSCVTQEHQTTNSSKLHSQKFRVRDGSPTMAEMEQVKAIVSVIPIFACTIFFNTILAQLQTFSVQQGSLMNTSLGKNFHIPPASLQSIPYLILIVLVPVYESIFVPSIQKLTRIDSGIYPLHRIGIGLFSATFSMVVAALVEKKRRDASKESSISIFWIAPQYLIFGVSEMFTAVGLIEFFYKQSKGGMQAFLTAMTYCSYSFGFFLSSLLVSLVNKITYASEGRGWLAHNDLNKDRLDLFYWLLAGLSALNFMNYLYWSRWYSNNSTKNSRVDDIPI